MATKARKQRAQHVDDAESIVSDAHETTALELNDEESYFQDIDLLQNHGIVRHK